MNTILIAFAVGASVFHLFPFLPNQRWLLVVPIVIALWIHPRLRPVAALLSGVFWSFIFAALQLNTVFPQALEGKDLVITGLVSSIPTVKASLSRFEMTVFTIESDLVLKQDTEKIRLSWLRPQSDLKPGQVWRLKVRLKRPWGFQNPGGFLADPFDSAVIRRQRQNIGNDGAMPGKADLEGPFFNAVLTLDPQSFRYNFEIPPAVFGQILIRIVRIDFFDEIIKFVHATVDRAPGDPAVIAKNIDPGRTGERPAHDIVAAAFEPDHKECGWKFGFQVGAAGEYGPAGRGLLAAVNHPVACRKTQGEEIAGWLRIRAREIHVL